MTDKTESAWVIVKWQHSVLVYWTGIKAPMRTYGIFSDNNLLAVRFARQEDAAFMLAEHLDGEGKVEEHMWVPK